jgi:hypothetical protein
VGLDGAAGCPVTFYFDIGCAISVLDSDVVIVKRFSRSEEQSNGLSE